jgi:hypothetical protein
MQLLDDIGNFAHQITFAQLEAMAAYAKLCYPGITTSVRQRPSELPTGTYASLGHAGEEPRRLALQVPLGSRFRRG